MYVGIAINVMYNCKPLSLFKFSKEIISMTPDSVRLSFTTESGNITEQILNKAQQAFIYEKNIQEDVSIYKRTL